MEVRSLMPALGWIEGHFDCLRPKLKWWTGLAVTFHLDGADVEMTSDRVGALQFWSLLDGGAQPCDCLRVNRRTLRLKSDPSV